MPGKKDPIRKIISEYHNPEITKKVADAFKSGKGLRWHDFGWEDVAKILTFKGFKGDYTLGLSGNIRLNLEDINANFPHMALTNQLTNPDIHPCQQNIQGDISLFALGKNSSLYKDIGNVLEIYNSNERSEPPLGVSIKFGENKKLIHILKKPDYERILFLHGEVLSAFVVSHKDGKVYSMNDLSKF